MSGKIQSYVLVISQFSCISILILTHHLSYSGILSSSVMVIGIGLGFWAIFAMQKSHLSVMPDYTPGSQFINTGPYRFIRHPMYLAVIIFCTSLIIDEFSFVRSGVLLFLVLTLLIKIEYEEKQLIAGYAEYASYSQKTKKLIPFLY